jgi:hypothetical protein
MLNWNAEAVPRDTEWREVAYAHLPSQDESALHPFVLLQLTPTMCEVRQKMPCSLQACAMIQTRVVFKANLSLQLGWDLTRSPFRESSAWKVR